MDERKDIEEYIDTLEAGKGLDEKSIRVGYQKFKEAKSAKEIVKIASTHGLKLSDLQSFVDEIIGRMIFDGEKIIDLLEPLDLSWRDRTNKELELMVDLIPLLKKLSGGREIVGLKAYE